MKKKSCQKDSRLYSTPSKCHFTPLNKQAYGRPTWSLPNSAFSDLTRQKLNSQARKPCGRIDWQTPGAAYYPAITWSHRTAAQRLHRHTNGAKYRQVLDENTTEWRQRSASWQHNGLCRTSRITDRLCNKSLNVLEWHSQSRHLRPVQILRGEPKITGYKCPWSLLDTRLQAAGTVRGGFRDPATEKFENAADLIVSPASSINLQGEEMEPTQKCLKLQFAEWPLEADSKSPTPNRVNPHRHIC